MVIPWGWIVIPIIALLFGIGFFYGASDLTRRDGAIPGPSQELIREPRRSVSHYGRLQSTVVAFTARLDRDETSSAHKKALVVRLIAASVVLCSAGAISLIAFVNLSWTDPTRNARAQETFAQARIMAQDESFDEALASQMTSMRGRQGLQVRSVHFEPRQIEQACFNSAGACAPARPDRPEQAWLGDLTWEEYKPGWSHWLPRRCQPEVLFTADHRWAFDRTRPCGVFI